VKTKEQNMNLNFLDQSCFGWKLRVILCLLCIC